MPPTDRRTAERIPADMTVTYRPGIGMPFGRARTIDVGEQGMLLRAGARLPVGFRVELDVEVTMPMRVRLGYSADALVIDGPMVQHSARLGATVRRAERSRDGERWLIGVEFDEDVDPGELRIVEMFMEFLDEQDSSIVG